MNRQEQLNDVNRKIFIINILGAPGAILIGLSLYAIFEADGNAFHPALNNLPIVYSMLVFGVAIEAWQLFKLLPLFKKRAALAKNEDSL